MQLLLLLPLLLPSWQDPEPPASVEQGVLHLEELLEAKAEEFELGQALMALSQIDDPLAAEEIADRFDDFNGILREAAIIALGNCKHENRWRLLNNIVDKSKQLPDRLTAARVMVKHPEGRARLITRFKKLKDGQVQALLISSLGDNADAHKLLKSAIKSKNPALRGQALRKASEIGMEDGRKAAEKALGDANLDVKRAAALACGTYGGADLFEALADEASDAKAPELRAGLRRGMQLADSAEEVEVLALALNKARKPEAKGLIAQALIVAGSRQAAIAGPAFAQLLEEEDAGLRQLAVRGIEATAHEAALPLLVELLDHEEVLIRSDAVRAMGSFQSIPDEFATRIMGLLQAPDPGLRLSATLALRAVDPALAFQALTQSLKDEAWAVRDAAVEVLADFRTVESVLLLAEHMQQETGLVQYETYQLLRKMTGEDFGLAKNAWDNWAQDRPADYELPSPEKAERMLAELEARKRSNAQGYGGAEYHGLEVKPGGTLFILDISGSMGFNYTPDAQLFHTYFINELKATIRALNSDHDFNIVAFSSDAIPWKNELVTADDESKASALAFLSGLRPWGATNLSGALQVPFRLDGVQQVYLMTDGDPTRGMTLKSSIIDWIAEQNRSKRIRFNTIIAGDVDGNFLAEIAALNGGWSVDLRPSFDEEVPEEEGE